MKIDVKSKVKHDFDSRKKSAIECQMDLQANYMVQDEDVQVTHRVAEV